MNDLFPIICYTCSKEKECSHAHLPGERLVGCGSYRKRPATNADRIRSLSDEELAKYLTGYFLLEMPNAKTEAYNNALDWLRQEVDT